MSKNTLKQLTVSAEQFPSLKNEDWRYTEVAQLLGTYVVPDKMSQQRMDVRHEGANLTFVDGFLAEQNLPKGVLFAHNTLTITDGVKLDAPLTIVYAGKTPAATWSIESKLNVGTNSSAIVREVYKLTQDSFAKTKLTTMLEKGSSLTHVISTRQNSTARVITGHACTVAERGTYKVNLVSSGLRFARHELDVSLAGPQAAADLRGVQLATGSGVNSAERSGPQVGTHVSVDHRAPKTRSTQTFRGVVRGTGSNICHSKVFVRQEAGHSNSDQLLKTILLDPQAKGFARPELHVANDQVQCRHGSAVGSLSKESLFYLKSRGFTEEQARNTLVRAFVMTDLESDSVSDQHVRTLVEEALS